MQLLTALFVVCSVCLLIPDTRTKHAPSLRTFERRPRLKTLKIRTSREVSALQASIFIERFALSVSAGLGTVQSLQRSCPVAPTNLRNDIELVLTAIELGQPVDSALLMLSDAHPNLTAFVGIVSRSHRSGAPLVQSIDSLTEFTRQAITSDVTRRIRSVGVKAVLPLGLCFLPAFVLVAVVPVISGLVKNLT